MYSEDELCEELVMQMRMGSVGSLSSWCESIQLSADPFQNFYSAERRLVDKGMCCISLHMCEG